LEDNVDGLIRTVREAEEALEETVADHIWVVKHAANQNSSNVLTYEEKVSAGLEALTKALPLYNPDSGALISTYIIPRVHGAIKDEIRTIQSQNGQSRSHVKTLDILEKAYNEYYSLNATTPTTQTLSQITGISEDVIIATYTIGSRKVRSLEETQEKSGISIDHNPSLAFLGNTPEETAIDNSMIDELKAAVSTLSDRERKLVVGYYFHNQTVKELGKSIGIGESRTSQLLKKALRQIREQLANL
jgi:RNA polymerase sigma factor for flagellar operon FliA